MRGSSRRDVEHLSDYVELFAMDLFARLAEAEHDVDRARRHRYALQPIQERILTREQLHGDSHGLMTLLVRRRLNLSIGEMLSLLVLAAVAIDARVRALIDRLREHTRLESIWEGVVARPRTSHVDLSPAGTLRRLGLVERVPDGRPGQPLAITPRMLAVLQGTLALDPEVAAMCSFPSWRPARDAEMQLPEIAVAAVRVSNAVVLAVDLPDVGRAQLLRAIARKASRGLLEIDARQLQLQHRHHNDRLRHQLRLIAREAALLALVPLIHDADTLATEVGGMDVLRDELACFVDGPVLLTCRSLPRALAWDRPVLAVRVTPQGGEADTPVESAGFDRAGVQR